LVKSQDPDPGWTWSYFLEVKIIKFFDANLGSVMEETRIRDGKKSDPGRKKVGSGINIRICNTGCLNMLIPFPTLKCSA
jgi:hypothetical protein